MTLLPDLNSCTVAVIGLSCNEPAAGGGIRKVQPCLRGCALQRRVIGFDIKSALDRAGQGIDRTRETSADQLLATQQIFTSDPEELARADVFVVTVPPRLTAPSAPT